jgi:hypothetical protein
VRAKPVVFALVSALLCGATVARAQSPLVGDWEGTLRTPARNLRFVLHVTQGDDGAPKATLDSVDQSALGIPVSSITLSGTAVAFGVNSVHGAYTGTLAANGSTIDGTWHQTFEMPLQLKRVPHVDAKPSDIDGVWSGTLDVGGSSLRIVMHITNTPYGLIASLDSPDQDARGYPATMSREGAVVKVDVKPIRGNFEGKLDDAHTTIDGTWWQNGANRPLVLKRDRNAEVHDLMRPQNPVKPYPYREENVTYENTAAHITLAATLTMPPGPGPFPAVVLLTGSGAQDRDETILGHRPFLVLADYLTRRGIAVLRADDRGVGQSGGDYSAATTADFATDAEAGVRYLLTRHEVNSKKIGLVGHSEGGLIAPIVAGQDPNVAFIVLMAGSGVPGDDIIVEQGALMLRASGVSQEQVDKASQRQREILTIVKNEKDPAVRDAKLRVALEGMTPTASIPDQIRALTSPWHRYFIAYDPALVLKTVKCPVLAINGERDLQVPAEQNLAAIKNALQSSGNTRVTTMQLPGLNHLFQTAKTGLPSEYGEIQETVSPVALDAVASWILKQ